MDKSEYIRMSDPHTHSVQVFSARFDPGLTPSTAPRTTRREFLRAETPLGILNSPLATPTAFESERTFTSFLDVYACPLMQSPRISVFDSCPEQRFIQTKEHHNMTTDEQPNEVKPGRTRQCHVFSVGPWVTGPVSTPVVAEVPEVARFLYGSVFK